MNFEEKTDNKVIERKVTMVDDEEIKCNCTLFNQYDMVCPHVMMAVNILRQMGNLQQDRYINSVKRYFPAYINVGMIHASMENWHLEYGMNKDIYEMVTDYDTNCCVQPPPPYKETTLTGKKRRIKSQGELSKGDYISTKKKPFKTSRFTEGGMKTKVKYYKSHELKYYGIIATKGYFDIKPDGSVCDEKNHDEIKKVQHEFQINHKIMPHKCSYCKTNVNGGLSHNIRTCKNVQRMGKSEYRNWEEGEFKLLHFGGKNINDLSGDHNLFTFREGDSNDEPNNLYDDKIIGYDDNPSFDIDFSSNTNIQLCESINHNNNNASNNDNEASNTRLEVTPSDKEQKENLLHNEIRISNDEVGPDDTNLLHIKWGIDKKDGIPRIYNTCALDSLLFIIYHIQNINKSVQEHISEHNETIKTAIDLLKGNKCDEARYYIGKRNTYLKEQFNTCESIDFNSAIGDWLPIFNTLTGCNRLSTLTCDHCNKRIERNTLLHSIHLVNIDTNLQEILQGRETIITSKKCDAVDSSVEIDTENVSVYDQRCKGELRIEDQIIREPIILTITAEETSPQHMLFCDLPSKISCLKNDWILKGIVTKSKHHFRSVIRINDKDWVFYDGLDECYIKINIENRTRKDLIETQGKDFGIISTLYCNERDIYVNNNIDIDVVNKENDNSVINNGKKNYGLTDEMDIFTQYSDDENNANIDGDAGSESDESYKLYEKRVIECRKSELPFELGKNLKKGDESSDDSSDDSSIVHRIRQMEPLYIGDVVEHQHPFNGWDGNLLIGMVTSIDRKRRSVSVNTIMVLEPIHCLRRIVAYDPIKEEMVEQQGALRSVEKFDLVNIRPENNNIVMEDYLQKCKRLIESKKREVKSSLKTVGLPDDMIA